MLHFFTAKSSHSVLRIVIQFCLHVYDFFFFFEISAGMIARKDRTTSYLTNKLTRKYSFMSFWSKNAAPKKFLLTPMQFETVRISISLHFV